MDKVKRITNIALFIGERYGLSDAEKIKRASYLCKADLVSNMVYEFPELQGIMGRYYALHHGENEEVSQAIFEHYLPRFAGDELPLTETGIVLSLAEKIDNLTGFFAMGIKPSGSQDPYALRRQAMGIVNIILDKRLKINLSSVLEKAYQEVLPFNPDRGEEETKEEVLEFILQRMRGIMLDQGVSYDIVDAVFACPGDNLVDITHRISVLKEFRNDALFTDLMTVFNRCHNLSKKWEKTEVNADVLIDKTEKVLYQKYLEVKDEIEQAVEAGDYKSALIKIAYLRGYVDDFFNAVMVMVEDERLKGARLGILKSIVKLCGKIADFSKIIE